MFVIGFNFKFMIFFFRSFEGVFGKGGDGGVGEGKIEEDCA